MINNFVFALEGLMYEIVKQSTDYKVLTRIVEQYCREAKIVEKEDNYVRIDFDKEQEGNLDFETVMQFAYYREVSVKGRKKAEKRLYLAKDLETLRCLILEDIRKNEDKNIISMVVLFRGVYLDFKLVSIYDNHIDYHTITSKNPPKTQLDRYGGKPYVFFDLYEVSIDDLDIHYFDATPKVEMFISEFVKDESKIKLIKNGREIDYNIEFIENMLGKVEKKVKLLEKY